MPPVVAILAGLMSGITDIEIGRFTRIAFTDTGGQAAQSYKCDQNGFYHKISYC